MTQISAVFRSEIRSEVRDSCLKTSCSLSRTGAFEFRCGSSSFLSSSVCGLVFSLFFQMFAGSLMGQMGEWHVMFFEARRSVSTQRGVEGEMTNYWLSTNDWLPSWDSHLVWREMSQLAIKLIHLKHWCLLQDKGLINPFIMSSSGQFFIQPILYSVIFFFFFFSCDIPIILIWRLTSECGELTSACFSGFVHRRNTYELNASSFVANNLESSQFVTRSLTFSEIAVGVQFYLLALYIKYTEASFLKYKYVQNMLFSFRH